MMNKIDAFLERELLAQTPKDRLRSKLGMNDFSSEKFDDIYRKAQETSRSIAKCEWCSEPFLEKNIRSDTLLCPACSPGRQRIVLWKARHKVHNLSDADKVAIANDNTVRYGRNKPTNK